MAKFLVVALEASSNAHLRKIIPYFNNIQLEGICDKDIGFSYYKPSDFAIIGFVGVIKIYNKAKNAISHLVKIAGQCDKVLLLDAPAFNIPLLKALRKSGFSGEIIYYILPQVWVWKKQRVAIVEKYCDKLICILPFERLYWTKAVFFGNPLMNIKYQKQKKPTKYMGFLPGSRNTEIKSLMPIFREITQELKHHKFYLAIPKHLKGDLEIYGDLSNFEVLYDTQELLSKVNFAFICSGTATLEASLNQVPFISVYKLKFLDLLLVKYFSKIKFLGLANIILDLQKQGILHPEFINHKANVKNLVRAYRNYDYKTFKQGVVKLESYFNQSNVSLNIANYIQATN